MERKINGWVLCKLKSAVEENDQTFSIGQQSMLSHIKELAYGVITEELFPPTTNWVFLANGNTTLAILLFDPNPFSLDPTLQSLAKLSQREIQEASAAKLEIQPIRLKDESYKSRQKAVETFYRGYAVQNCPVEDINGKYMENGTFNHAPLFTHVRGWVILRCSLSEIDELGITKEEARLLDDQRASAEKYFEKAGKRIEEISFILFTLTPQAEKAFLEIVATDDRSIKDGSADFTTRFIEIARAGNRLVTADQTIQNLHYNNRRTEFISQASLNLLRQIAGARFAIHPTTESSPKQELLMTSPTTSHTPSLKGNESQQLNQNELEEVTTENIELQMVINRQITYQSTSLDSHPDLRTGKHSKGNEQWDIESELAAEVLSAVESREEKLLKLRKYAQELEKIYLSEGYEAIQREGIAMLEEIFQDLRLSTIDFAEAYGRWARFYARAHRTKKSFSLSNWNQDSHRKNFCVVIGYYGVGDLYGASEEVKSNSKKFRRSYEPPKKNTTMQYVGEYDTEEAAFRAFHSAITRVPQELLHPDDLATGCKPLVSFRSCLKHYLVRTSMIPPSTPCEQCAINQQQQIFKKAAVLYEGKPFPSFLYKQYNYSKKIWNDLNFLSEFGVIKKHYNLEAITFNENPFLVPTITKDAIAQIAPIKHTSNDGKSMLKLKNDEEDFRGEDDPLYYMTNSREKLQTALKASREYYKNLKRRQFEEKYRDSPYNEGGKTIQLASSRSTDTLLPSVATKKVNALEKSRSSNLHSSLFQNHVSEEIPVLFSEALQDIPMIRLKTAWKIIIQNYQASDQTTSEIDTETAHHDTATSNKTTIDKTRNHRILSKSLEKPLHPQRKAKDEKTDMSKTIDVSAGYFDRGVDLTLVQKRFPPAHRRDDMFARTDIGEFAGLTKGRAVRAFDFKERLYLTGKEREEIRKNMQERLRSAIAVHIVECDEKYIRGLIEEAKEIRGSVLQLDIIQAENFIQRFHDTCTWALLMQALYRGSRARTIARQMKKERTARLRLQRLVEIEASRLARLVTPIWLETGFKNILRKRKRPFFSCVVNLSNVFCIVSLFEGARSFRNPLAPTDLCSYCLSNLSVQSKSRLCLCRLVRCCEKWMVRYYFPVDGKILSREFSMQDIAGALTQYEDAQRIFLNSSFLNKNFEGPLQSPTNSVSLIESKVLLEPFRPLFRSLVGISKQTTNMPEKTFVHRANNSYSQAWFQAARESAVLPRVQYSLPKPIRKVLHSKEGRSQLEHLATTIGPKTILNYESVVCRNSALVELESRKIESYWNWEPLHDHQQLQLLRNELVCGIEAAKLRRQQSLNVCEELQVVCEDRLKAMEIAMMINEDQRSLLYSLQRTYDSLLQQNKEIMEFTKGLMQQMTELELQQHADETRSYDSLEDGFRWKDMYKVVQIRKNLDLQSSQLSVSITEVEAAKNAYVETKQALESSQIVHDSALRDYQAFNSQLQIINEQLAEDKRNLRVTFKMFASLFSFRQKLIPTLGPHIGFYPYDLFFLRHPLERLKKENRKVMVGLTRKAMTLYPMALNVAQKDSYAISKDCKRYLVSVFLDEITGSVVINLSGGPSSLLKTEESCQHEDLELEPSAFSPLTQFIQPGDIVLTAGDLSSLLKRSPNYYQDWPASNSSLLARDSSNRVFILPSQRPRLLKSYRCLDNDEIRKIGPTLRDKDSIQRITDQLFQLNEQGNKEVDGRQQVSYYRRRQVQEEKRVLFAQTLLSYLKLHPHSCRPCFGLLHLIRRRHFCFERWKKCAWYSDKLTGEPACLTNVLLREIIYLPATNQRLQLELFEHLQRFQIVIRSVVQDKLVPLVTRAEVHLNQLLHSFVLNAGEISPSFHDKSLVLQYLAFLHRAIIGNYQNLSENIQQTDSTNLRFLSHVVPRLMYEQTGKLRNHIFRPNLSNEIPIFRFEPSIHRLFKQSSHFQIHRFVCGKYCCVKVFFTLSERHIKIELSKPRNNLYGNHQYLGSLIVVILPTDLIRIFLLKNGCYNLFQRSFQMNLMEFILSRLSFESMQSRDGSWSEHREKVEEVQFGQLFPSPSLNGSTEKHKNVISINFEKFHQFAEEEISKYKSWVERRHPTKHMDLVSPTLLQELRASSQPPRWHLTENNSSKLESYEDLGREKRKKASINGSGKISTTIFTNEQEQIPIFQGFWSLPSSPSNEKSSKLRGGHLTSRNNHIFLGSVRLSTNADKSSLFMNITECSEEERLKESEEVMLSDETNIMMFEDHFSQLLRKYYHQLTEQTETSRKFESTRRVSAQLVESKHNSLIVQRRTMLSSRFYNYKQDDRVRKKFRDYLQLKLFWRFFAQHFMRFFPLFASGAVTLFQQILRSSLGKDETGNARTLFQLNFMNSLERKVLELMNVSCNDEGKEEKVWNLTALSSIFFKKYSYLQLIIEAFFKTLRFQVFAIRSDALKVDRSSHILREDCLPSRSSNDHQFRSRDLWFRNELVFQKPNSNSTRGRFLCSALSLPSKDITSLNEDIFVDSWQLTSFGVMEFSAFHFKNHSSYRLYLLPCYPSSISSLSSSSEKTCEPSFEGHQIFQALENPVSQVQTLSTLLTKQFAGQFVQLCFLQGMMKVHLLNYELEERGALMQLDSIDKENSSNVARISITGDEHDSILIDESDQFQTVQYPTSNHFQSVVKPVTRDAMADPSNLEEFDASSIFSLEDKLQSGDDIEFSPETAEINESFPEEEHAKDDDEVEDLLSTFFACKKGKQSIPMFFASAKIIQSDINEVGESVVSNFDTIPTNSSRLQPCQATHYVFYIPVDEALPAQVQSLKTSEISTFIATSLQCSNLQGRHLFEETDHFLLAQVILYQNKAVGEYSRMNPDENDLNRTTNFSRPNPRLQRLLPLLLSRKQPSFEAAALTVGTSKEGEKRSAKANEALSPPPFPPRGDVVLLIRDSKDKTFIQRLVTAFQQWERDYRPLLLLRQEKAGKERQWKLLNQQKFSIHIHRISYMLTPLAESLFGCHRLRGKTFRSQHFDRSHPSFTSPTFSLSPNHYYGNNYSIIMQFIRLLLRWFDFEKEKVSSSADFWRDILSRADSFLPQSRVYDEQYLQQFDCRIVEYSLSLRGIRDDMIEEDGLSVNEHEVVSNALDDEYFEYLFSEVQGFHNRHKTRKVLRLSEENQRLISPIQCLYALFQRHITTCSEAMSQCVFPCCRSLRSQWFVKLQEQSLMSDDQRIPSMMNDENREDSRAQEILQDILKDFLSSRTSLLTSDQHFHFKIPKVPNSLITAEDDILDEKEEDDVALAQFLESKRLQLFWERSRKQIRWLEFLQQHLLSSEIRATGISPLEVLQVEGGLQFLQYQKDLDEFQKSFAQIQDFLPFVEMRAVRCPVVKGRELAFLKNSSLLAVQRGYEWTSVIFTQVLKDVLSEGSDFDPYPLLRNRSSTFPLSESKFTQVMKRFRFSQRVKALPPPRLCNGSKFENSGSSSEDDRILSFDRLLKEGVVVGNDGRVVILHFLYGIMTEAALSVTENVAVPEAGLRYVSLDAIQRNTNSNHTPSQLFRGITLLVYDVASEVSRAAYITERQLRKCLEWKQLNQNQHNYHSLANLLFAEGRRILDITRLDSYFISVKFRLPFNELIEDTRGPVKNVANQIATAPAYSQDIDIREHGGNYCQIDDRRFRHSLIAQILSPR